MGIPRLLTFSIILFAFQLQAQDPFIQTYYQDDYHADPDNYAAIKSDDGIMYFANGSGVLEFDGHFWNLIEVPGTTVRSLAKGIDGTIYIGTVNNFGYLKPDKKGIMRYVSLSDSIKDYGIITTVWFTFSKDSSIVFVMQDKIISYHSWATEPQKKFSVVNRDYVSWAYFTNNEVYLMEGDRTSKYQEDTVKHLKELDDIYWEIMGIHPYRDNKLLLLTIESGLIEYSPATRVLNKFKTEAEDWCIKNNLYETTFIPLTQEKKDGSEFTDTLYALTSMMGGIIIIDMKGKIILQMDQNNGLGSNNASSVYYDKESGILWAMTNDGITKIHIRLPFRQFNTAHGIKTNVYSILEQNDQLYIGTDIGLYKYDKNTRKFENVDGIISQCWEIKPYEKGLLVAAGNAGLYYVVNDKVVYQEVTMNALFSFLPSASNTSIAYGATYSGLVVFKKITGEFRRIGKVKPLDGLDCRYLAEDGKTVWTESRLHGFYRVELPSYVKDSTHLERALVLKYGKEKGLVDENYNGIFTLSDGIYFTTKKGIHTYNRQTDLFEKTEKFHINLNLPENQYPDLIEDIDGNIWFTGSIGFSKKMEDGSYKWNSTFLNLLPRNVITTQPSKDGKIWLGGLKTIYKYDNTISVPINSFSANIRKTILSVNDSLIFGGSNIDSLSIPILAYNFNSIKFEYAAPCFLQEQTTQYTYMLKGFDKTWSEWSKQTQKEYTNLSEGKYKFIVQAKNVLGTESQKSSYEFEILPPWYRTSWAYLLYVLGFILVLWGGIRLSVSRLRKRKEQLEKIVVNRTKEISQKNETLEEQKEMLSRQNKDILDSINYARRIQSAMLTSEEHFNRILPEHFVLYKPRDVVSGDFYWCSEPMKGKVIWAAADCTGHGVPGAFMSMIGITLLNEIVNKEKFIESDKILNELRDNIIKTLGQTDESQNRDGMDAALCIYDKENMTLEYSGANNPLYVIREKIKAEDFQEDIKIKIFNDKLCEIVADKQPIAYEFGKSEPFRKRNIKLQKGDTLYTFSDGYADQFGGERDKKFSYKKFKTLLLDIYEKSMEEQKKILNDTIDEWKEGSKIGQVDDICVVGVRIS
ncbi:MAG: hypothetical protein COC01_09875 [Bacteroidetes bacterium]|nr:SpoIIE family protein phosphatase [Sphingobacteriaceae bacterium AH-315-L07]PCH65311.1 MAG: hypothetical protein COC01_09875 [Bacteroidota bacterium]